MAFLFKFILLFIAAYLIMKGFAAFLTVKRYGESKSNHRTQSKESSPKMESQEERIINYQKKNFEKSEAEDVDFIEIKEPREE